MERMTPVLARPSRRAAASRTRGRWLTSADLHSASGADWGLLVASSRGLTSLSSMVTAHCATKHCTGCSVMQLELEKEPSRSLKFPYHREGPYLWLLLVTFTFKITRREIGSPTKRYNQQFSALRHYANQPAHPFANVCLKLYAIHMSSW